METGTEQRADGYTLIDDGDDAKTEQNKKKKLITIKSNKTDCAHE